MPTAADQSDLWSLVYGKAVIDPNRLLAALQEALRSPSPDFRTRLLIRDCLRALERRWGIGRLQSALSPTARDAACRIAAEELGEPGFPSLEVRMADATDPRTILQFLREVGERVPVPARLDIGGSSALILRSLLSRATEDIDVVDEVPAAIRVEHDFLN